MGADPYELECFFIRFAVDEHKIGLYVAVAVILPVAAQRMIAVAGLERRVDRE